MQVDELVEAVEALTKVRHVMIDTDNGPRWATGEPRLKQLQDEIYATIGKGGGSGGLPSERLPLSSDVLYRAAQITSQIGDWCRMAGLTATRDPIIDLDAWCADRVTREDREDEWYIAELEKWAREIDSMFDRPRPLDIVVPCPVCGAKSYTDDSGDICTWPLKASYRPFRAECRACTVSWDGEEALIELAEEIGVDVSEIRELL